MGNKTAVEFDRTVDIKKAFNRAFELTDLKKVDFALFMGLDLVRAYRIRNQKNMQTDTVQRAVKFFSMSVSEFIALGE